MSFIDCKTENATKGHICECCDRVIHPTEQYVIVTGKVDKKIYNKTICFCCSFLSSLKEGPNKGVIIPGEYTEKKIPNRLRKIREEFYQDMPGCLNKYKQYLPEEPSGSKLKRVVVSADQFNRTIINVPSNRFNKLEDFFAGQEIMLSAGVKGPQKKVTIKSVSEVDGKSFCRDGKCLAILLEK
jgi:hypothetical protein